jgi:flagellar biosynthesis protein FliR
LIGIGPDTIVATFLIFCRVGACIMLMPGVSSPRVPVRARLFIAIGITLALAPLAVSEVARAAGEGSPVVLARLFVGETMIGAMIGVIARFFLLALETLATSIAMAVGLGNVLGGPPLEGDDAVPPITSMITFAATVLIFLTDLHWEVLRGLAASYTALPVTDGLAARFALAQVGDGVAAAFFLALRISSPFIIFAIVVNLAVGILNKLTPQIPVYFISAPFVIAGGLVILYFTSSQLLQAFVVGFTSWLRSG